MYNIPCIIRRFLKSKNLRIVNLLGLSLIFACIPVSYTYIKREHGSLDYARSGVVCRVVEDLTYTNIYEDAIPMIILQRNIFMNCFMIRFVPGQETQATQRLNEVWKRINTDYPINYKFFSDSSNVVYKNELNAGKAIENFSGLCFIITILGLIIFYGIYDDRIANKRNRYKKSK